MPFHKRVITQPKIKYIRKSLYVFVNTFSRKCVAIAIEREFSFGGGCGMQGSSNLNGDYP